MTPINESNTSEDSAYPNENKELRKLINKAWIEAEAAHVKYKQIANDKMLYFVAINPLIIEYHVQLQPESMNLFAYRHDKIIEIRTFDKFFGIREWPEPKFFKHLKTPNYTFSFN